MTDSTAVASVMADTLESMRLAEKFGDLRLRASSLSPDDAVAMQVLVPGWKFDPKRPALDR